jgi:uncharacterized protein YoxC
LDPAGLTGKQIGARLASAMSGPPTGKVTTLVGVGRDNVQMQLLSLPPSPPEELPELVRFQADREFTTLGSDAALDFIPIAGDAQSQQQVLAVALSPAGISEARELCEALGVEADRIPLRACAAAALVERAEIIPRDQVALIVNPLTDEADLTVRAGDEVVLMRTVRLPDLSQDDARQKTLVSEIRRTMAAVRQQLADGKVAQVIVCGTRELVDKDGTLATELEVPVTLFDPLANAPSGLTSHGVPADSLSRFAGVLGMALAEADRQSPLVDFANVRRRPAAERFSRTHALAAAAAAVALVAVGIYMWRQLANPAQELAALEQRIRETQAQADQFKDVTTRATAVERWLATDVNWLDEMEQFARRVRPQPLSSKEFPVNDDVVITQLTMYRPIGVDASGGQMQVQAKAKSFAAVRDLEQRLRDEQHGVETGGDQDDKSMPGYPWSTSLQVRVANPSEEDAEATP